LIDSVRQAERGILRYLIAHEDARDTIEGIEKWWLPQSCDYGVADIAAALQRLQNRDLICVWKSKSAKPVYGRGVADLFSLVSYLESLE
jgi:hypothetical protein